MNTEKRLFTNSELEEIRKIRLIAAAPELLAFAEVAAQETELCDAQDLIDRLAALRATARAVIAKAKGVPHE